MRHILFTISAFLCLSASIQAKHKTPLMGWSSWNAYMVNISDSIIRFQTDQMVKSGLRDAGYAQINIDDGFFGKRTAEGKMTAHATRFPNGMKDIVEYIHSKKMKAGIYSDAGDNTCGSQYNHDTIGVGAGLYRHDIQDAELYFNEWNFDFIKIDYCGGRHAKLNEEARYREIRRNIDATAHKPISINICRWAYPGTWVTEVGDSWRTTGDIRPNWKSVSGIIAKNMYLSAYARNGHYNDMDMLAIGYKGNQSGLGGKSAFDITKDYLNDDEEDAHFGIWCIMASPLLIGCKIEGIPQRSLNLLKNKELIALDQDPLGLQAHVVQHTGSTYVFAKDLLRHEGPQRAVALYNPTDMPQMVSVTADELGYEGAMKVRDLLKHTDLTSTDNISLTVPAHGIQMLKTNGKRREQTCYEAEWAYMPRFTAIAAGPTYRPQEEASGRMVADGLGGEGNNIEWSDIYSYKGGTYSINIATFPTSQNTETGEIILTVNGQPVSARDNVTLKKGFNSIRLSCPKAMPAIDCIKLHRN